MMQVSSEGFGDIDGAVFSGQGVMKDSPNPPPGQLPLKGSPYQQ